MVGHYLYCGKVSKLKIPSSSTLVLIFYHHHNFDSPSTRMSTLIFTLALNLKLGVLPMTMVLTARIMLSTTSSSKTSSKLVSFYCPSISLKMNRVLNTVFTFSHVLHWFQRCRLALWCHAWYQGWPSHCRSHMVSPNDDHFV